MDTIANNQITLLSLMQKASFQLIDAVIAFNNGNMVIDAESINEVLAKLDDKAQAKVTVAFLINLVNHTAMFNAIKQQADNNVSESKRVELTPDELETMTTGKAINIFKALNKLKGVITAQQAFEFLGGDLANEEVTEEKPVEEKPVEEAIKDDKKA